MILRDGFSVQFTQTEKMRLRVLISTGDTVAAERLPSSRGENQTPEKSWDFWFIFLLSPAGVSAWPRAVLQVALVVL